MEKSVSGRELARTKQVRVPEKSTWVQDRDSYDVKICTKYQDTMNVAIQSQANR